MNRTGINIAIKGVKTYMLMNPDDLWWLMLMVAALRFLSAMVRH